MTILVLGLFLNSDNAERTDNVPDGLGRAVRLSVGESWSSPMLLLPFSQGLGKLGGGSGTGG